MAESNNIMKISFDIDDTYTKDTMVFDRLRRILQAAGHQVGVLSGRAKDNVPGGPWDFIVGGKEIEDYPPFDQDFQRSRGKSELMKKYKIDLHFDNMADSFEENLVVVKI